MKRAEAPSPGWYPDPRGRQRLRWWDGTDWTDVYRPPPSEAELGTSAALASSAGQHMAEAAERAAQRQMGGLDRAATEEIISQVRQVARSEVDRAAEVFTQRASAATREIQPLISEYTSKFFRWLRIALVIAVLAVVVWFAWQVIFQASLFEWIGDRIDNLTDDGGG